MRILYVGQLWEGGTARERMKSLASLGHTIIPFNTTKWVGGGNPILLRIAHRLNMGPNVHSLNRALRDWSRLAGPVDVVWVDKGVWITVDTLLTLREKNQGLLLHYTPDAHFFANRSRQFHTAIPEYDIVVTTKSFEVDYYRDYHATNVLLVLQGYDPRFQTYERLPSQRHKWKSDVAFIGHHQPHYADILRSAASSVASIEGKLVIHGPRWTRYARFNRWSWPNVKSNGVWGDDYLHALAHARIALGLLGKHIPETNTTRTFEIPAIGTFLLAERNEDHLALFQEGVEAEFFDSKEELYDKIHFYLRNEQSRSSIAASGRQRALRSGYSSLHQLRKVLEEVARLKG